MLATRLPSVSETPPFAFLVQGLPTGGGGSGNGEPDLVLPALALSVLSERLSMKHMVEILQMVLQMVLDSALDPVCRQQRR